MSLARQRKEDIVRPLKIPLKIPLLVYLSLSWHDPSLYIREESTRDFALSRVLTRDSALPRALTRDRAKRAR